MIGKIKRVGLREVWKHEAYDFTQWLEDNIDVLNDVIDLKLSSAEREKAAGTFSADLVAEDENGNPVVIENQLERSNHDHLGKVITYLTTLGAKCAIWIVSDPRPEHVTAISWLNESSSASFYLLKLEAIQIGDSEPAPLLTLIVGPSEEGRKVGETKKEFAERHILREKWWTELLDNAKTKTKLHATRSPTKYNWIGVSAGKKGLLYCYSVNQKSSTVELYIDPGVQEENQLIFEKLKGNKDQIEKDFGGPLEWEKLETKRACRIAKRFDLGGYKSEQKEWATIHNTMTDAMVSLDKTLAPHIKKLKVVS